MALVVILGTAGIVYSRDQRQPDGSRPRPGDHWHAAIGFNVCGTFAPPLPQPQEPAGLHTHGEGLVHIEPSGSQTQGKRATLGVLFDTVDTTASAREIKLPSGEARKNGESCEQGPAKVQTKVWDSTDPGDQGRLVEGDPSDLRPQDGMLVTVAFVPEGVEIPRPPSAGALDEVREPTAPIDPLASTTTTSVDPGATSTTVADDPNVTTTTVAGSPMSTSAPTTTTRVP